MVELKCSLCDMTFDTDDPDYRGRTIRHDTWHNKAWVHHRNTTQGDPTYE